MNEFGLPDEYEGKDMVEAPLPEITPDKVQRHQTEGKIYIHYGGKIYTSRLEDMIYPDRPGYRSGVIGIREGDKTRMVRAFFEEVKIETRRFRGPNKPKQ